MIDFQIIYQLMMHRHVSEVCRVRALAEDLRE